MFAPRHFICTMGIPSLTPFIAVFDCYANKKGLKNLWRVWEHLNGFTKSMEALIYFMDVYALSTFVEDELSLMD